MKKFVAFLYAGILLFASAGCKTNEQSSSEDIAQSEIPQYTKNAGKFFIGAYCEPYVFDQSVYDDIAACGLTHIYIDPWFNGTTVANEENICKALELCEKAGIKALIMPNNTHEAELYADKVLTPTSEYKIDYSQYPAFDGFYAFDEPYSSQFDWIVDDYNEWVKKYPNYTYLVNMMAQDNKLSNDEFYTTFGDKVISNFNSQSKIFSIDNYPLFRTNRAGKEPRNHLNETYLNSMEDFSYYSKQYGCDFYSYISTFGSADLSLRRPATIEEVRWQVAIPLVFGAKGIECFSYTTMAFPNFIDSMVSGSGEKYDLWYWCQEVFGELRNWENVYFSFNHKGVMAFNSAANSENSEDVTKLRRAMTSHERIKNYSAQRDLLIGVFEDSEGYDGFLFTTYNDPYYRKYNKITVEFNNASKLLIYKNGEQSIVDIENGLFEYELAASDMLFVIPIA